MIEELGRSPSLASADATNGRSRRAVYVSLAGAFTIMSAVSASNLLLPSMRRSWALGIETTEFVIVSYLLAYTILLMVGGRLGDIFARKAVFVVGMGLFAVASLLCAAAPTFWVLALGRLVQGAGAALVYPQALALVEEVRMKRAPESRLLGIFGAAMAAGIICGQMGGGTLVFLDPWGLTWRAPFVALAIMATAVALSAAASMPVGKSHGADRVDWLGTIVLAIAVAEITVPLLRLGNGGGRVWELATISGALVTLVLFLRLESRAMATKVHALIDPVLQRDLSFSIGLLMTLVFFATVAGITVFTPFALQAGLGATTLWVGLVMAPGSAAVLGASLLSPWLRLRLGIWHALPVAYLLLGTGAIAVMLTVGIGGGDRISPWLLSASVSVVGVGQGLGLVLLLEAILPAVEATALGRANGAIAAASQLGQLLGVVLFGHVFAFTLNAQPMSALPAIRYTTALESTVSIAALLSFAIALLALFMSLRRSCQCGLQRRSALSAVVDDRAHHLVSIVGMAVNLLTKAIQRMSSRGTVGQQELAMAVGGVLKVHSQRAPGTISVVGPAPMNGETMVEAHLATLEDHGNFPNGHASAVESPFQPFEIAREEVKAFGVVRPTMATVYHCDGTYSFIAVVEGDPGREHVVRRAALPVLPVGVPADVGADARFVRRLVE